MEKRELLTAGIIFIIFALSFVIQYSLSAKYAVALIAAALGVAGTAFLYYSGSINNETAILSSGMFIGGGAVIPFLALPEGYYSSLIVLCFIVACALMVLKPPDRKSVRAPVQN